MDGVADAPIEASALSVHAYEWQTLQRPCSAGIHRNAGEQQMRKFAYFRLPANCADTIWIHTDFEIIGGKTGGSFIKSQEDLSRG
jgi:hypothetical protein